MANLGRAVDDVFFDRFPAFQKISNFFEYFGVSHVTLAQLCVIIGAAFAGSQAWRMVVTESIIEGWGLLGVNGIQVICFLIFCQLYEGQARKVSGLRNVLRSGDAFMYLRLVFGGVFISFSLVICFDLEEWWRSISAGAMWLGYYFIACDHLPPGDRFFDRFRRRQLVRSTS